MNILPVVSTLKASKEVTDLLGTNPLKVWEDIAPHKTPYPYAVWSVVTANPENHLDCPANTDHVSFQIVVYDTQQKRASDIRAAIRKALEPHCYITNIHPNHFERIADTNIFGRGFDANWFLDRQIMKDKIVALIVVLLIAAFTCLMVYAIWQESTSPKIDLNKSEWECVKTETRITNVIIGGKLMPQSNQECVEYKRN